HLKALKGKGDGVLITPNHPDLADPAVMFMISRRAGVPFCYMAAYQIFTGNAGLRKFILPRLGVFPVDREGADRSAFQAGLNVLTQGKNPLVVFPEGEIYFLGDRLTPLREGAAALALAAARKAAERGRTVWIIPTAIRYRFLENHDPLPELHRLMDTLEARFTWWDPCGRSIIERLYRYAEGMLALKELEYLDAPQPGTLKERIARLKFHILEEMEDRRLGRRSDEPVPFRVKELRRACLKALAVPGISREERRTLRRDLNSLFVAIQLFSYPGDYVRENPTLERLAEIMTKFEQDALGVTNPAPRGPRRAVVKMGEPIDVRSYLGPGGRRSRDAAETLTETLELQIQGLMDTLGPGRPLPESALVSAPSGMPVPQPAS
ncbi:MAG TPA: 1-acyl-sn-glycerol-3-phosphate acyltransferase, partial [Isosphaeraceae bacterium]|nr:1-acyl-sn-glycerol-3-phosphate acyltransferase [Isosphaeraceae bacterium]